MARIMSEDEMREEYGDDIVNFLRGGITLDEAAKEMGIPLEDFKTLDNVEKQTIIQGQLAKQQEIDDMIIDDLLRVAREEDYNE